MNIKKYIIEYLGINQKFDTLNQTILKLEKELIEIDNNNSSNANDLYDIQHKVSYYDDYDLEVISSENNAHSNAIDSLQYQFGLLHESQDEVKALISSIGGTDVKECVKSEIEKYTVVVASSLQRKE
jgi:Glu-tRNA(Gln) amidotransferase subunit E-like FAD-binding protein